MLNQTDTFVFRRVHPVTNAISNGRASIQQLTDLVGDSIEIPSPQSSLPIGGSTGQSLIKNSPTDFDVSWGTVSGGAGITDGDKGDITVSGSGATWAIDAAAVSNSKLSNVATSTFKGRVTAGTGVPEDLTGTQATTLLDNFTSSLKGLAPASGGGTTNFLRADGTWAAPSGGTGTNLSYTASTRAVASSTGSGFTFPLVTSTEAGLAPLSGGGTANFLRADASWSTAVTSVGGTGAVSGLTLTGTVTGTGNLTLGGTLAVTASNFASQTANTFLAAPSGSAGIPTFRALAALDVPTLNQSTTGSAATLTTSRNFSISGGGITATAVGFNGSAAVALSASVDAGHITLARMANLAANSFIGNNTGSAATPIALTVAQTTAALDTFTTSLKGLAPASGGGTSNFLRADGTWAAPAGGFLEENSNFAGGVYPSGLSSPAKQLLFTDFLLNTLAAEPTVGFGQTSFNGAASLSFTSNSNIGVVSASTSTSSNAVAGLTVTTRWAPVAGGVIKYKARIQWPDALPSSAEDYSTFWGHNNGYGIPTSQMAGFLLRWTGSAVAFEAVTRASGTQDTTTLTSPTAATWVVLEVVITGTTDAKYYVNGSLVATHTNLPTGTAEVPWILVKNAGTTARRYWADWIAIEVTRP